jgi:hypothetical protein
MTCTGADNDVGTEVHPVGFGCNAVEATRTVRVAVIHPDLSVDHVGLLGTDEVLFAAIRRLIGEYPLTAISISDQDGLAAIGWVAQAGQADRLRPNRIATEIADRPVFGRMIVTGLGRGDTESLTSVHDGLRAVLDQMANRAQLGSAGLIRRP